MPTTAHKRETLLKLNYDNFLRDRLRPALWLRLREASDSIAVNSAYAGGIGIDLLTDGGFEIWISPTTLTNWSEAIAGTSTVDQEATIIHGGAYSARFDIDALESSAAITSAAVTGIAAGETVRFSFWAKASAAGATFKVGLAGGTKYSLQALTTSWQYFWFDIIATAANPTVFIQRDAGSASKLLYFDDAEVRKVGDLDAAITTVTLGQTGKLGANEAFDFNGTTSLLSIANKASINALTRFGKAWLVNLDNAGEANGGHFFRFGDGVTQLQILSSNTLFGRVDYNTTDASATTHAGQLPTFGRWEWVFMNYDETINRKVHLYRGVNGAVTEYTYSAQPASEGTRVTETTALILGNRTSADVTIDGKMDEFILRTTPFSTAEMQIIVALTGV